MDPVARKHALLLLARARPDDLTLCRHVESYCHAAAAVQTDYFDRVRHSAFNLRANPALDLCVAIESDEVLAHNTLKGRIQQEARARDERFTAMLQEKYDALNDETFAAIVRCRRCGSEEVTWEEKQTRSADEGATVFCSCTTCKNRWVMR